MCRKADYANRISTRPFCVERAPYAWPASGLSMTSGPRGGDLAKSQGLSGIILADGCFKMRSI
jgi:hypothetical protein